MGNICGTDIYKEVKEKYPEEFAKYLTGEEIKKNLSAQVDSAQSKVGLAANDIKKQNLGVIDNKEKEVKEHFEQVKAQVDKNYLGGVKSLEQMKGAKIEDLLGYSDIKKKYSDLKDNVSKKFTEEEEKAKKELNDIKTKQTSKIDAEKPNLTFFDSLSQNLKEQVYGQGVSEYKDQIEKKGKQCLGPLESKLSPTSFFDRFKNILPLDSLKNLTQISKTELDNAASKITGNPKEGHVKLYE